jgi:DNA repair protein RadA/Sms
MSKVKTVFYCQNCGAQSPKWIGKCPSCGEWNTYVEEVIQKSEPKTWQKEDRRNAKVAQPQKLTELTFTADERILTPDKELNRVLGGGIVQGSLVLIGGEPGIGKSTLLLQLALQLKNIRVLYVSGEESEQQIKMRADRIASKNPECFVLTETATANIFHQIRELQPQIVIIDSVQTLQSEAIDSTAGSISQIRETAGEFQRYAKETGVPVFLIGHITKEGSIAGPKILEHMVDTVLQFEGDRHYTYRILRTVKNRFGSTSELGIYEMQSAGLREVSNPSEILITQRDEPLSGIAIASTLEGLRPMLIETQALVTQAVYGTPQRTSTGFDLRRLSMLLAVLEKRCGYFFGVKDVFLNIAGGIKVEDPAIDLSVVCALISSFDDIPLSSKSCFAGEVGLSGEIRAVNKIEQRISEADKLGFERIYISKYNKKGLDISRFNIEVKMVGKVEELIKMLF